MRPGEREGKKGPSFENWSTEGEKSARATDRSNGGDSRLLPSKAEELNSSRAVPKTGTKASGRARTCKGATKPSFS